MQHDTFRFMIHYVCGNEWSQSECIGTGVTIDDIVFNVPRVCEPGYPMNYKENQWNEFQ